MNKSKVVLSEKITSDLWTQFQLRPGFNIGELIINLGIAYQPTTFQEKISGLFITEGNKKFIFVNQNEIPQRQRFSGAHELGHYYLHHQSSVSINKNTAFLRDDSSSMGKFSIEVEANYFAAALLMPKNEIQKFIDVNLGIEENTEQLAQRFDVSQVAMGIRLNSIGYYWS